MSFRDLKRNAGSNFEKLNKELEKIASNKFHDPMDEKLWKLTQDKAGNGSAIIRFLPAPGDEEVPFVRIWDHGFQVNGKWYIEKSLTTIGKDDPVSESNSKLWNSGLESDKNIARDRKRRLYYYSNIYVVKDPAHPENEGKVFLFKYGKKIFEKLNDAMNPSFDDDEPMNPFDMWTGANFRIKIRKVDNWPNYDKSDFDTPSPLADDDKMEEIYNQEYSLQELLDPKNFKTYDELKTKFDSVVGNSSNEKPWRDEPKEQKPTALKEKESEELPSEDFGSDDDDGLDLDFFEGLSKDDD